MKTPLRNHFLFSAAACRQNRNIEGRAEAALVNSRMLCYLAFFFTVADFTSDAISSSLLTFLAVTKT